MAITSTASNQESYLPRARTQADWMGDFLNQFEEQFENSVMKVLDKLDLLQAATEAETCLRDSRILGISPTSHLTGVGRTQMKENSLQRPAPPIRVQKRNC